MRGEQFGVPEERTLAFAEQSQAIEALKTGRADVVVYTITFVNRYYDTKGSSEGLEVAEPFRSPLYFNGGHFFRPDEAEFVEIWNDTLVEMKKDGFIEGQLLFWGWPASTLLGPEITRDNCCDFDDERHLNFGCLPG